VVVTLLLIAALVEGYSAPSLHVRQRKSEMELDVIHPPLFPLQPSPPHPPHPFLARGSAGTAALLRCACMCWDVGLISVGPSGAFGRHFVQQRRRTLRQ